MQATVHLLVAAAVPCSTAAVTARYRVHGNKRRTALVMIQLGRATKFGPRIGLELTMTASIVFHHY